MAIIFPGIGGEFGTSAATTHRLCQKLGSAEPGPLGNEPLPQPALQLQTATGAVESAKPKGRCPTVNPIHLRLLEVSRGLCVMVHRIQGRPLGPPGRRQGFSSRTERHSGVDRGTTLMSGFD